MKTRKDFEKEQKKLKRKDLQETLKCLKAEKAKLYEIAEKWWYGKDLGLRDKEEFYHRRLFVKNLEAKKLTYLRDNSSSEYVHYLGRAVSTEAKAWRDAREKKRQK
ncbi:hypothetical protein GOV14_01765 [Candidatus Pacearchaeota archaeon]|nr:hypothetical protein [Candidatus Pacearchaeota archaeon]